MTEHPNARVVRALFAGPPERVSDLLHEDVMWHLPGEQPMSGTHVGRDAVLAAMRYFEGVQLEVHDVVANDRHAVALLHARGDRGGRRYDALEVDVFHVRDGKIAEFWSFSEDTRIADAFWS